MSTRIEKVTEIMQDRAFVEKIAMMEDPAEVQAAFAEKGVEFTIDQVNQIATMVMGSGADELSEAEMDAVSGGILAEITIVASGVALVANCMAEYNKGRKEKGKSTIW